MNLNNQEAYILLIIETIQKDKKLNIRRIVKIYNISNTILQYKIKGFIFCFEYRFKSYNLLELEKNIISEYIIDIDSKGFLFKFKNVEDIVNYIFESRGVKCIEKF